jgi:YD repeat-containing protein
VFSGLNTIRPKRGFSALAMGVLGLLLGLVLTAASSPGLAGQERYEYDPIGRLIRYVDSNNRVTEYTYDAAGNILSVVAGGDASAYVPSLSAVTPNFIRRGEVKPITLTGQRLQVGTLQTSDAGMDLSNLRQTATQIQANLTVAPSTAIGNQTLTFKNAEGAAAIAITVGPRLPDLSVEPSPLALPPDNGAHFITLRLSGADVIAHQVAIESTDTTKATVNPSSVSFAAGQTAAQISITSRAAGFVNLVLTSVTLKTVTVPVFITVDFRGVNTSYTAPVGVVVGDAQPPVVPITTTGTFASPRVGVAVGAVLTQVAPRGLPVGTSQNLLIRGVNVPAGAQVSILPATGIVLGSSTVATDGTQIVLTIAVDATAPAGSRRVVVTDATAKPIAFADAESAQIILTTGQPTILSIEPLFATAGTTIRLKVRGTHLQNAQVRTLPDTDLRLDSSPTINADGTGLEVGVQIAALAATGARTVQVTTLSGQSDAQASVANQFTIVSAIQSNIGPISAPLVGIVVGSSNTNGTQSIGPIAAANVGVAVGAFAQSMAPKVGVIGTTVNLTINGQGLESVQSVRLLTSDGLTTGTFAVNASGTQLTMAVTVDAAAPKTLRRVVLGTATGPLAFVDVNEALFLVAAPAPDIISVAPQVIQAGQTATMTIRGQNFRDVTGVRFDPATGLAVLLPPVASADGTSMTLGVQAAANAVTGPRTVIVATAGGESSAVQTPANTVYVAQQTGPTYADIMAQSVGVQVGAVTVAPATDTVGVLAPLVGILVESIPTQATGSLLVTAPNIGVIVGTAITGMAPLSPEGFLKGATGNVVFTGVGLGQVTSAKVTGAGISLGSIVVDPAGTQVTVPVTVGGTATSAAYGLSLSTGSGTASVRVTSVSAGAMAFNVGALPLVINSMSPIVLEQGKTYTFTVRGTNLKDIYQLVADPVGGLNFGFDLTTPQWSTDALGEKLTATVLINANAAIGSRVIRLRVAGGITDATPTPANTITIVAPQ